MKIEYKLPYRKVSIGLIMDVVERCSHRGASSTELIQYTGKSQSSVKNAIDSAYLLQMVESVDENYVAVKHCLDLLQTNPPQEIKISIFRKYLQMWNPFISFMKYLSNGDRVEIAARKLSSFYVFNKEYKQVGELLLSWGQTCELISKTGEVLLQEYNLPAKEILDTTSENLLKDAQVRLYLINVLGDDIFNWLNSDEIEELENSILKYKSDPKSAVACAGRAYEDVLRRLSLEFVGLDTKEIASKTGISQLANTLKQHKSIHSKHVHTALAIGGIRNMASHGKDTTSMEKWELSPTSVLGAILLTIASIRSLFYYIKEKKYLL